MGIRVYDKYLSLNIRSSLRFDGTGESGKVPAAPPDSM